MARGRKAKGRYWIAWWLAVFLGVSAAVIVRQRAALATATRLANLKTARLNLEAVKAGLERRIRTASTAEALAPKVASLGLGPSADTATTILRVVGGGRQER